MKKLLLIFGILVSASTLYAQEICNNGIDDDADGDIDMNDADCACSGIGSGSSSVTSLIPNPSFEDYTCCPNGVSDLPCAVSWQQASNATSDYFNTCGYTGIFNSPNLPLPGGGAGYGGFYSNSNWEENIGACLNSPMTAGVDYQMDLNLAWSTGSTTLTLSIYGTPNCGDLPWNTSTCAPGSGGWMLLGTTTVTFAANQSWQQVSVNFTPPVDIAAVSIGGPCGGQQAGSNYYFLDELTLATEAAFQGGAIVETGGWCSNDLDLEADIDTIGGAWQWYDAGIAIPGETNQNLNGMTYGPGDYTAVYTLNGDCQSADHTITIPAAPVSDFNFTNQCEGNPMPFTDASTIAAPEVITAWDWDFGDGNTSNLQDPSNPFASPGTYTVSLTSTDGNGCQNTSTQDVTVFPNTTSDFEFLIGGVSSNAGLTGGCIGDDISFVNNSSVAAPSTITTWAWDFGDGTTSVLENPPNKTYAASGNYDITLTTTSDNGCPNTVIIPIVISAPPVVAFTVLDDCEDITADFTDNSVAASGVIDQWAWDFGDGNTSTAQNPSNLYAAAGAYTIDLTITTDEGCSASIQGNTTRFGLPTADFTVADVCHNQQITVQETSNITAPDVISNYDWTLGDGNTGAGATANHTYGASGTFDITLTTTSNNGCTDDITHPVTIYPEPVADFNSSTVCVNTPPSSFADMSAISSGTIDSWDWDFGDGQVGTGQGTQNIYGTDGNFMTTLTVTSNFGCVNSITKPVTVYEKPTAGFVSDLNQACSPADIQFSDLSFSASTAITQWDWDFFGGASTGGSNPIVNYVNSSMNPELYDVNLIVTNSVGCKDTSFATDYIEIFPLPESRFVFSPNVLTITESETQFQNSSINADEYDWDFGDNSLISNQTSPSHTYPDNAPGSYVVELIAYNYGRMCSDTSTVVVDVQDVIIFYVPNIFTPDGDDYNETWKPVFFSGHDPQDYHMVLFNRYGEIVWESYNANTGWNGHYGNGGLVEDGTYIWKVDFKETMSDKRHLYDGHVTVLK